MEVIKSGLEVTMDDGVKYHFDDGVVVDSKDAVVFWRDPETNERKFYSPDDEEIHSSYATAKAFGINVGDKVYQVEASACPEDFYQSLETM